jgi:hypothetical protein
MTLNFPASGPIHDLARIKNIKDMQIQRDFGGSVWESN